MFLFLLIRYSKSSFYRLSFLGLARLHDAFPPPFYVALTISFNLFKSHSSISLSVIPRRCSLTRTGVRTHFHLFPRLHQFVIPGRRPSFPLRVPLLYLPFFHIFFLLLLFGHFFRLIHDGLHQHLWQANLSIPYFLSRIHCYGARAALRLRVLSLEVSVIGRFRFARAPLSLFHGTVTPSLWPIRLQFLYLLKRSVGLFNGLFQTL